MFERAKERLPLIRPLLIPLVLYISLLAFSMTWLKGNPDSGWRIPIALLPMLPGTFLVIGMTRAVYKLDEMQRMVLLEGMAFSFTGTLLLTLTLGLLDLAVPIEVNPLYIGLALVVLWLVGKLWTTRRYE